ncbi:NAD(P)/FAD-dependent oxidoreductase [Rhodospirillum rubrum]|uniref:Amine oxidase n=1 Tax=Rhodospirillum rubrum (strain ATCC 11170 / ATH 1.1.1 / DSM 467 / LMG 4362 / NCIMB 8255 / S1) TaxID=269796 RepID=Q2RWG8_RHORT|nr:NAD/FAD-binding protein [Rhodospirillum rubrum]ABC21527.1 Amine oxidase [Rhodospirillum rubrum ATCC 11170]AEO47212.1 amine oxidase [Rhodospirillum rubrum F11]MBK5953124.1 NAD/FAD-binding protein [Rhodospirillum rubrum]QXG81200.1 NAD/FAD-binding protein [Rhodospirillum rubrum]
MTQVSSASFRPPSGRLDIAVVGTGIAGSAAAWLLSGRHAVTIYEADQRPGGHTHTVAVRTRGGASIVVDTGFIVYNEPNYPNLVALFDHLGVKTRPSDMSFSVSADGGGLEYSGAGLGGLLAQPVNLVRPRFWAMMRDLVRFYRGAPAVLEAPDADHLTLGDLLKRGGYSQAFIEDHLLPMGGAIWSSSTRDMADYPARAFISFFQNHALLDLGARPLWRTVAGGSREYLNRLIDRTKGSFRLGIGARRIFRDAQGVRIEATDGGITRHDHVLIATHADQALAMLGDPSAEEARLLGPFAYQANDVWLHQDDTLMPRRRRAWAAWNALTDRRSPDSPPTVTYWMNRLQGLDPAHPVFITLNPSHAPAADSVLGRYAYDHPLFTLATIAAQKELWRLQGVQRTWFCGSYFGAGFHEDALQSGLLAAERLGGVRRPWTVEKENARLAPWPAAGAGSTGREVAA